MKQLNIQSFLINSGHTSELQPLDVIINAPLKGEFRAQWEKWMMESTTTFTNSGKRQKPKYDVSFQIISESIKKVGNPDNIKRSFLICGLHCFHQDQKHQGGN